MALSVLNSNVLAETLPNVENVRVEGSTILWDALPGAAGYNIYTGAITGSKQGQDGFIYIDTVTNATSYEATEPLVHLVVAFNEGGTAFSDLMSATTVGVEDNFDPESVSVSFFNDALGRYLVERSCTGSTNECVARCDYDSNGGNATGGFCRAEPGVAVQSDGSQLSYACTVDSFSSLLVAGVYCVP